MKVLFVNPESYLNVGIPGGISILSALLKKEGHTVIVLLGVDSIIEMDNWKDPDALHFECEVVGLTRPGIKIDRSEAYLIRQEKYSIKTIEANSPLISSSEIRKLFQNGADAKDMVPRLVYEYILKKKLYHS